ncbi:MAG: cyclic nucleotide-binding domain-containing protein [Gallionella sp.]
MSEFDDIQTSLADFTQSLGDHTNSCFSELRKSYFFDRIPNEILLLIAEQAKIKSYAAGDFITKEGDILSAFYVILFGMTTVCIQGQVLGTIIGGECIGEGTFFANINILRTASVIADEEVRVAEIDKKGIDCLLADEKVMAYINKALLLALFKKLQGANRRIQDLLVERENDAF